MKLAINGGDPVIEDSIFHGFPNVDKEEIFLEDIKKVYLQRVSHEGIYNLHHHVEELQQENEEQKEKF